MGGAFITNERNDFLSIASEITRINTNIAAAYTACGDKGATMPQTQNSANLADTIDSISSGGGTSDLDAYIQGSLTEITSNVTSVKKRAFSYEDNITSISLPAAITIGERACDTCANLQSVIAPTLRTIEYGAFANCVSLSSVVLSDIESIRGEAFSRCFSLSSIDLNNIPEISANALYNASYLSVVIIRRSTLCTLRNISAFTGTPFRLSTGGTVYVPQALVSTYQNATNWSALESVTFLPIEGSIYE